MNTIWSGLLRANELQACYLLHNGYSYPVETFSELMAANFLSFKIKKLNALEHSIEIIVDDQVSYLLYLREWQSQYEGLKPVMQVVDHSGSLPQGCTL